MKLLLLALTSTRLASRAVEAAQVLPMSANLGGTHRHTAEASLQFLSAVFLKFSCRSSSLINKLTRPVQCMKLCSCHTALWRCRPRHFLHSRQRDMGKSGKSYYAVKVGRTPGQIFRTWPECESQVS